MSGHVVIVGGGLSGLAAGVELASRGIRVTILEQKPAPGGRAYSFRDGVIGDTIDNGQHVLIAGYERTLHFLDTIGTRNLLHIQSSPTLQFHHPQKGFRRLQLPLLPVPFNFLVGVLSSSLFSITDRLRILKAGFSLRRLDNVREDHLARSTIEEWLRSVGQTDECIRSFWEPLAVSIMNEQIRKASALVFVRALRQAFLGGPRHAALAIPSVGLSQLFVDGAKQYIALRGGEIRCNTDVVGVVMENGVVRGVKIRGSTALNCDAAILAVPHHKLQTILPDELKEKYQPLEKIDSAPIVSIHLWFEKEFMVHESVGLIGRRIQWLFNRRMINKEKGKGAHVSAVISGAHDFVDLSKDELVKIAMDDMRSVYGGIEEEPRHAVVIREKSATYASSPEVEPLRPSCETAVPNLFLAGDWTATGYPATIEGAIISAERAVQLAGEYLVGSHDL
jgi:squalene-associated FAD-dependent desaturase